MYAVIRIRGTVNISPDMRKALEVLNLRRINNLSIWKEDEQMLKMIKVVQDYVTFGKLSDSVLKELIAKKAHGVKPEEKIDSKKVLEALAKGKSPKEAGIVNCFRMSPPSGGFERKGVKIPFKLGGAAGDRKEKINELIQRMM